MIASKVVGLMGVVLELVVLALIGTKSAGWEVGAPLALVGAILIAIGALRPLQAASAEIGHPVLQPIGVLAKVTGRAGVALIVLGGFGGAMAASSPSPDRWPAMVSVACAFGGGALLCLISQWLRSRADKGG